MKKKLKLKRRVLTVVPPDSLEDPAGGRRTDFNICYHSDRHSDCHTDCGGKCEGVTDQCYTGPGCGPGRRPTADC